MLWPKKRKRMNESFMEYTSCPICCEDMIGKIWQCKNGHLVCNDCNKRNECESCPECRDILPRTRNLILEKIIEQMESKCKFCNERMLNENMKVHIPICTKRPLACCSFDKYSNCNTTFETCLELINHLRDHHNYKFHTYQLNTEINRSFSVKVNQEYCQLNWIPIIYEVMREEETLGYVCVHVNSTVNNYFFRAFLITDRSSTQKIKINVKCGSTQFQSDLIDNINLENVRSNRFDFDEIEPLVLFKKSAHKTYSKQNTEVKGFTISLKFYM